MSAYIPLFFGIDKLKLKCYNKKREKISKHTKVKKPNTTAEKVVKTGNGVNYEKE